MPGLGFACRSLRYAYPDHDGGVVALEDVGFEVEPGGFLCVVGPSGCGKTTLLKLIAGLLPATAGEVVLRGAPAPGRPASALVFQEGALLPWLDVLENVGFGLECLGVPEAERLERSRRALERVGLGAFLRRYPHQLSAGMRQRVGLVRALLLEAPLLLLDEPFAALDAQHRLVLQQELLALWREQRPTVVFVTHDIEEAVLLGDEVLVLSGRPGRVLERVPVPLGRPRDLLGREDPALQELRRRIWRRIEPEVRRDLGLPA